LPQITLISLIADGRARTRDREPGTAQRKAEGKGQEPLPSAFLWAVQRHAADPAFRRIQAPYPYGPDQHSISVISVISGKEFFPAQF